MKPVKCYDDLDYIRGKDARHIRILLEHEQVKTRLKDNNVENTVVIFGSARTLPPLDLTSKAEDAHFAKDKEFKKQLSQSRYYEECMKLSGDLIGWSDKNKTNMHICSGGGPGIMEAANKGAFLANPNKSIGYGISLPFEAENNEYITENLSFEFHYFFIRKFWLTYHARAVVAMPGGFGTMDEIFEILTLVQCQKMPKVPIVLYGKDYWNSILNLQAFADHGVISEEDLNLFKICDTPEEALEYLTKSMELT